MHKCNVINISFSCTIGNSFLANSYLGAILYGSNWLYCWVFLVFWCLASWWIPLLSYWSHSLELKMGLGSYWFWCMNLSCRNSCVDLLLLNKVDSWLDMWLIAGRRKWGQRSVYFWHLSLSWLSILPSFSPFSYINFQLKFSIITKFLFFLKLKSHFGFFIFFPT